MKQTINQSQFIDAFADMNRSSNFSYEALELLFDYFESIDEDMELDVIAICCEYAESTIQELINNYNIDVDSEADNDEIMELITDYLNKNTSLIGVADSNTFVYVQF